MLVEPARKYGLGMDALVSVCSWNMSGLPTAPQQNPPAERPCRVRATGLGMDALLTVCSWNPNGIMVWAWMLWLASALGT